MSSAGLQPIVELANGAVVGAKPDGMQTWRPPVCELWAPRDRMPNGVSLSVTISPDVFAYPEVQQALASDLAGVVVIVTKAAAANPGDVVRHVTDLRTQGALTAVDDAWAGYAGLLRLGHLRPDVVKPDAGMVSGGADGVELSAAIEALVTPSQRIDSRLVGQGVETLDNLQALVDLDVEYAQGWVLAHRTPSLAAVFPAAMAACRTAGQRSMRRQAPVVGRDDGAAARRPVPELCRRAPCARGVARGASARAAGPHRPGHRRHRRGLAFLRLALVGPPAAVVSRVAAAPVSRIGVTWVLSVQLGVTVVTAMPYGGAPACGVGWQTVVLALEVAALGLQSSTVLTFGVPGLSTTYLTATLTTMVVRLATGHGLPAVRQSRCVVIDLIIGAAVGLLSLHTDRWIPMLRTQAIFIVLLASRWVTDPPPEALR